MLRRTSTRDHTALKLANQFRPGALPTDWYYNLNGDGLVRVYAPQCNSMSIWYHFLGSKGAFGSAVVLGRGAISSSYCAIDGLTSSCLKFTGECSQKLFPSTGCSSDPNAAPWEISCWCHGPISVQDVSSPFLPGATYAFPWTFLIDKNLDGKSEQTWMSYYSTDVDQARFYPILPEFGRLEWEDELKAPEGDFNDYILGIEARDCRPLVRFPDTALLGGAFVCSDRCGDNPCDERQLANGKVKFTAAVGIDSVSGEGWREKPGRLLQITVNTYDDFIKSDLPRSAAICPVLRLDWRRSPRGRAETNDLTIPVRYGSDDCRYSTVDTSGEPRCLSARLDPLYLSIGLAVEQLATTFCGPRKGVGDWVSYQQGDKCAAFLFSANYEMSIDKIDSALSDPTLKLGGLSDATIGKLVAGLDIYVFNDIKSANLHCPSGVNVTFDSAAPDIATVTKYTLDQSTRNLRVYQRK